VLSQVYRLLRPALFTLAPEDAHEATLKSLEAGVYPRQVGADDSLLAQRLVGLDFPNPIGVAAGFDKDARVPDALLALGCGFAEIGTVTPKPQGGNPKPRVFRLIEDQALINRLGFNNGGHDAAQRRLSTRANGRGVVGVNIGANKDSADRAADYVAGIKAFNAIASYFTINISSPNTPGLRDLQAPQALDELLGRVMTTRSELIAGGHPRRPIIVKIAPDIADEDVTPICQRLCAHEVDAVAVSNTTLSRNGLISSMAQESGGLSGRPLFNRSTIMLARVYGETSGSIPLIGVGGIDSAETAIAKMEAGASLLQLYTGLIYHGPGLIGDIKRGLAAALRREHLNSITALVGRRAGQWAARELD
jgi:dihydroorotate dehydrogenase